MEDLKKMAFFAQLNKEELERLREICMFKDYKKGEILFYEGEEPKYLNVLLKGSLKIYKTNAKSQQIFLHQFVPINFVAELACFEGINYPASSEFLMDGEVLKIDFQKFKDEFLPNPVIAFKIIKSLSSKLKIMSQVLHQETILNSEGKVAKFIVENSELFGAVKNVQIASLLNLTPETLSRILAKFRQDKILVFDEKHYVKEFDKNILKSFYE